MKNEQVSKDDPVIQNLSRLRMDFRSVAVHGMGEDGMSLSERMSDRVVSKIMKKDPRVKKVGMFNEIIETRVFLSEEFDDTGRKLTRKEMLDFYKDDLSAAGFIPDAFRIDVNERGSGEVCLYEVVDSSDLTLDKLRALVGFWWRLDTIS